MGSEVGRGQRGRAREFLLAKDVGCWLAVSQLQLVHRSIRYGMCIISNSLRFVCPSSLLRCISGLYVALEADYIFQLVLVESLVRDDAIT